MTIIEAISAVDQLKSNAFTHEEKLRWLSRLEQMIRQKLVDTHEGGPEEPLKPFDETTPLETELLAPEPFDDIYIKYLELQMDYANGEFDSYANAMTMFNSLWMELFRAYHRTHLPKSGKRKFF